VNPSQTLDLAVKGRKFLNNLGQPRD